LSAFFSASHSVRNYVQSEFIRTLSRDAIAKKKRTSRKHIRNYFRDSLKEWVAGLSTQERRFWHALKVQRGKEVHAERTKTRLKEKAVPVEHFPRRQGYSERAYNFAAYYLQQQQTIYYQAMTPAERETLGLPSGATVARYVQEHRIEGFDRAVLTICEDYIHMLDGFVRHFEQSAP
jgi:hypothetical protein